MAYEKFQHPFVRDALAALDAWAGDGLVVEHIGDRIWRVKARGADADQDVFVRATPSLPHLEPYLAEPSDEEVATLKQRFGSSDDVVFPYLRGGRGRGALLRVRRLEDLAVLREVVVRRKVSA